MSKLFESEKIKGMELSNRFVRSATWEGMAADDGAVTPKLIETMIALAKGGVGMIITSHAYVRQEGQAGPWQIGVYKDELIDGLKEMAAAVHENGSKIVMQIAQGGLEMSKLFICLSIAVFMSLAACGGTRYNWVPQADDSRPPNTEYEGTGIPDPNSEL